MTQKRDKEYLQDVREMIHYARQAVQRLSCLIDEANTPLQKRIAQLFLSSSLMTSEPTLIAIRGLLENWDKVEACQTEEELMAYLS